MRDLLLLMNKLGGLEPIAQLCKSTGWKPVPHQFAHRLGDRLLAGQGLSAPGLIVVTAVCAVALWIPGCRDRADSRPAKPTGPNVLVVVIDTARADYFSCYGHERPTTPRIDRLAGEGIRYKRAYATDFWTLPSHASLFTGLYPTEAQATSETNHLPDNVTTLAERLREAGYQTGAVVCNAWVSQERGFGQGFADFAEMWRRENQPSRAVLAELPEQGAVNRAIAWMERQAAAQLPFFLFVNFNVAHLPYRPPPEIRERFVTQAWPAEKLERLMALAGMWPYLAGATKLDQTDFQIMRELYEAEVSIADTNVGQLLDALGQRSLLEDTLVIVTSDHGENIGDHGMMDHLLSMYETTLHIPLIIRYPKCFSAGTVSEELVSIMDVAPTVLDICNLLDESAPPGAEQMSLCGEDRLRRSFVVAENERPMNGVKLLNQRFPSFDTSAIDRRMRMIRTQQHKLIWQENAKLEVYDLKADPKEIRDLAESHPEIRDQLLDQLEDWMANLEARGRPGTFQSRDSESIQRLRAIGYVD